MSDAANRHRLSVADYYRMAEVGILAPDSRVERFPFLTLELPAASL